MTRGLLETELEAVETGELLLPLVGTFVLTGIVAAVLCQPPVHPESLAALFGLAAVYILIAGVGHAAAVWLVQHLFDGVPWPTETLIVGLWSTVAWLPLLSLLTARDSLWVAATLPFIVNCGTRYLRRSSLEDTNVVAEQTTPFLPIGDAPFWRALLPAALVSASLECGIVALFLDHPWIAGSLLAAGSWLPVWRLVEAPERVLRDSREAMSRKALGTSFAAWLLTLLALVPFASGGLLAEALHSAHAFAPHSQHHLVPHTAIPDSKGQLQFVVLLQPPQPRAKEIIPPERESAQSPQRAVSVVIPFDGPYWFFKRAGDTPTSAARREQGDPRKVNIRSTDGLPLLMEAHQAFEPPLRVGVAHTLEVRVVNADDRSGEISMEVLVTSRQGERSLGTLPLRSSMEGNVFLGRKPIQDSLSFSLPARRAPLEKITVRFKPDSSRALAAPKVALQSFTLKP